MSTALHTSLISSLSPLASSASASRSNQPSSSTAPIPALPADQLEEQVRHIWTTSYQDGGKELKGKKVEMMKTVMELVGRELTVSPIVSGELSEIEEGSGESFLTVLQDRLDIVLTLYEVVYSVFPDVPSLEPGAIFIPLLEELVELVSVESWRNLWLYVESRSKRFTKDMPASKGKALPLLRTINAFLRFLPRTPEDLVFRGRVHQFASSVISVADKSAINMRGDYNEIKTTWEEVTKTEEEGGDDDVKMEGEEAKPESDFYATLWSIQQYFAHPPSLDGPAVKSPPNDQLLTPFEQFKIKTDFVLPKLFEETDREKERLGKDAVVGKKRKREEGDEGGFFYPRYLTGKRLLEHELADSSFRRQILVQYFILFQFLLNLTPATAVKQAFTGGMPKTFVIDQENETWVKGKVSAIREELRKMVSDGPRFEDTVLSIITRERHYAQWKNDGCPETVFEVPPLDKASAKERAALWKRRLAPPRPFQSAVGTRSLSRMWKGGYTGIDQLKGWKRKTTLDGLYQEIKAIDADEEDDKAMGVDIPAEKLESNAERRTSLTWRALRLASRSDLRHFASLTAKRDLNVLMKAINDANQPRPNVMTKGDEGKEAEADAEAEADVSTPAPEVEKKENEEKEGSKVETVKIEVEETTTSEQDAAVSSTAADDTPADATSANVAENTILDEPMTQTNSEEAQA